MWALISMKAEHQASLASVFDLAHAEEANSKLDAYLLCCCARCFCLVSNKSPSISEAHRLALDAKS